MNPDNANKMLTALLLKHELNVEERDVLLSELMCCYINKSRSDLMDSLIGDDLLGFRRLIEYMNKNGIRLTRVLRGLKDEK